MTISGINPLTTMPTVAANGTTLAGSNPLLAGATAGPVPTSAQLAAMSGVTEKPGIGTRLVSAMKAAISELRGQGASNEQIRSELLALEAQRPVSLAKSAVAAKPKGAKSAKKVVTAKTWKTLAPKTPAPTANAAVPTAQAQLPANATQLPGATVYSYDQNGNPAVAGLQGLDPATQQQLGMTPTMLQGVNGLAQAVDPDGPQVNATNQTSLNGTGSGLLGSAVPVLGAPIVTTPAAAPAAPGSAASTGANQSVTNRNTTDVASRNENPGYGYGTGWGDLSGVASPYSPYGDHGRRRDA